MAEEAQVGRFNSPEEAWGAVDLRLKNYPDVDADRGQKIGALMNIAEGLQQYFLLKGDRQAAADRVGRMKLPVTLLGDMDLALGELGKRYVESGNRLEEGDWSFFEGVVNLREVIEAGEAGDPGVTQEFKDKTENARKWFEEVAVQSGEKRPTEEQLLAADKRMKEAASLELLGDDELRLVVRDVVMVFTGQDLKWDREQLLSVQFLMQRFGLLEKGLAMVEESLRLKDNELAKLAVVFVSVLPDNKLTQAQVGLLRRAVTMVEGEK